LLQCTGVKHGLSY